MKAAGRKVLAVACAGAVPRLCHCARAAGAGQGLPTTGLKQGLWVPTESEMGHVRNLKTGLLL